MAVNTLKEFLPVLGLVLVLVIVSMMVVSYFNVNMNDTDGLLKSKWPMYSTSPVLTYFSRLALK